MPDQTDPDSNKLEAECKVWEMLIATERADGSQPYQSTSTKVEPVEPTLSELGLTKRESAEAQMLARIPGEIPYRSPGSIGMGREIGLRKVFRSNS